MEMQNDSDTLKHSLKAFIVYAWKFNKKNRILYLSIYEEVKNGHVHKI